MTSSAGFYPSMLRGVHHPPNARKSRLDHKLSDSIRLAAQMLVATLSMGIQASGLSSSRSKFP